MMRDDGKRKVYSPDIHPYSFEGSSGLLNTISYLIVAPFRLVSRVMHNIFVMPANIQDEFAEGLFVVALLTSILGVVDLVFYHKWVLLISQLPLFPVAYYVRKKALAAKEVAKSKRTVEIDYDQVEELVSTVYNDLNKIVKE